MPSQDDTRAVIGTRMVPSACSCGKPIDHVEFCYDVCGATDGLGLLEDGEPYGRCNLLAGHDTNWHRETRDGEIWAEWRGPAPGEQCGICGKDGAEH